MENYPEIVAKIANDYLERLKLKLSLVPANQQDEFLREIQSHVFEAYRQTPGEDDVSRILTVLRNLGEPVDVVADRLPGAMVRSGSRRNLPLYIVAGVFIALFGIPLGFGGVSVLVGLLLALTWLVVVFFALTGATLLAGTLIMIIGLSRFLIPRLFDPLIAAAAVENNWPMEFINQFSPSEQGLFVMLIASIVLAAGMGLLWLGKRLLRGLRFLFSLAFDWTRRLARNIRLRLRRDNRQGFAWSEFFTAAKTGSPATR